MKKILKTLIFPLISLCLILCLCLSNKVSANSGTSNFVPFVVDDIFPVGFEFTQSNSNGVMPSKGYIFIATGLGVFEGYEIEINLQFDNNLYYVKISVYSADDFSSWTYEVPTYKLGYWQDPAISISSTDYELVQILNADGDGLLGTYVSENNVIYNGVYELLANLFYGTTENLTDSQAGSLVFFSQLIVIFCLLLPFVIVIMVIRLLFK